jgi:glycosyltransferase involved in cell wall biosynthesis
MARAVPGQVPLCSIVMPVRNGERFLEAALQSVLSQSVPDFELIVVDNASVDATPKILTQYAHDPRVKVVTHPFNKGIAASRNAGLNLASTDLIVNLDADDLMAPERLERQLAYMEANPAIAGAGTFYYIIDEYGEVRGKQKSSLTSLEQLNRYIDGGGNPIFPNPAMIFRKSAAISVGGYREEYEKCEDVDLFLRMILGGHVILVRPEYLTYYRYHSVSTTARNGRRQFELNEILFSNFRRQRAGLAEISASEFREKIARLSLPKKLGREAKILSRSLLRRRDMAKLRNKRVSAALLLLGAAACDPGSTVMKMRRQLATGHKRDAQDTTTTTWSVAKIGSHLGPRFGQAGGNPAEINPHPAASDTDRRNLPYRQAPASLQNR